MPPKANINGKKAKLYNSRTIRSQISDSSFVDKERLNISDFLTSRSFEISAFELAQLNSKHASATRVFQNLPRVLRRRTASHNVKRIPKRLRNRALREMASSIKGTPPKPDKSKSKQLYKMRMTKKLLKLGNKLSLLRSFPDAEVFNKKLNLRSKLAVLDEQIKQLQKTTLGPKKLNNVLGSYDNTGVGVLAPKLRGNLKYHKRQNEFVWLPSHIWHAKRFHLIKQFGYQIPLTPTQKCFRLMNRQSKQGAILFDTCYYDSLIVEIPQEEDFSNFLLEVTKYRTKVPESIRSGKKSYNGWLRFHGKDVGLALIYASISSKKVLIRVHPSIYEDVFQETKQQISGYYGAEVFDCRYSLGSIDVSGPIAITSISKVLHLTDASDETRNTWFEMTKINDSGIIPVGTTFCFNIHDPRLWKSPTDPPVKTGDKSEFNNTVNQLVVELQSKNLVSQASLNQLFTPEGRYESYNNQLSIKHIGREFSKVSATSNSLGKELIDKTNFPILVTKTAKNNWTIICPWFWILPIWTTAVKVTKMKTGGVRQKSQLNFESETATYPQDYPWLRDGWQYNENMGQLQLEKYSKVPKHHKQDHKQDYKDIKYMGPFKCEWTTLRNTKYLKKLHNLTSEKLASLPSDFAQFDNNTLNRIINSYHDLRQVVKSLDRPVELIPIEIFDRYNEFHNRFIKDDYKIETLQDVATTKLPMIQISLKIKAQGTIKDNARIYPLEMVEKYGSEVDLCEVIGFVTSGTLNLNSGTHQGIGLIIAQDVPQTLYIRNIGESNFHLVECRGI